MGNHHRRLKKRAEVGDDFEHARFGLSLSLPHDHAPGLRSLFSRSSSCSASISIPRNPDHQQPLNAETRGSQEMRNILMKQWIACSKARKLTEDAVFEHAAYLSKVSAEQSPPKDRSWRLAWARTRRWGTGEETRKGEQVRKEHWTTLQHHPVFSLPRAPAPQKEREEGQDGTTANKEKERYQNPTHACKNLQAWVLGDLLVSKSPPPPGPQIRHDASNGG